MAFSERSASAAAIRRLLAAAYPTAADASLVVHPDDDMFAFSVGTIGSEALGAMAYFRAGASMMDLIETIAQWHFNGLTRVGSFLDFAGGYGRSTRFLTQYMPADRITVGEIQSDALAFQAKRFGVGTLQSSRSPSELPADRLFDFVFVASLFSHLPRATFGDWLRTLWDRVADGGLLVFSVHDEVLDTLGACWEDDFAFIAQSEVSALDTEQYGTTLTREPFIRRQLAQLPEFDPASAVRLPRGLCFNQDVWVVAKRACNPAPLLYENGPQGAVDRLAIDGRRLTFTGWAGDSGFARLGAETHRIARVVVRIGRVYQAEATFDIPRPDVAEYLGHPSDQLLQESGWTATALARRHIRPDDIVLTVATCEHGRSYVLDSVRAIDLFARFGVRMPVSPLQRRRETARAVYAQSGYPGLTKLVPVVVRNELRRLRESTSAAWSSSRGH